MNEARTNKLPTPTHHCSWAGSTTPMQYYPDQEWGVPLFDSSALWGKLMLDGFQAGLSWSIILRKRESFLKAFHNFGPEIVARFTEKDILRLTQDGGIVRARAKIEATIGGARAILTTQNSSENFSSLIWNIASGKPIQHTGPVPTQTSLSLEKSNTLQKQSFKFVGPVIVYAWMQAVGITNGPAETCFRRKQVQLKYPVKRVARETIAPPNTIQSLVSRNPAISSRK